MTTAEQMRSALQGHVHGSGCSQSEGLAALFANDARVEEPVECEMLVGLAGFEHASDGSGDASKLCARHRCARNFDGSATEFLVGHKGIPEGQVEQMVALVGQRAAEVGLVYHIDKMRVTNTRKAHEVLHLAKVEGRQLQLVERFFTAAFPERRDLGRSSLLPVRRSARRVGRAVRRQVHVGVDGALRQRFRRCLSVIGVGLLMDMCQLGWIDERKAADSGRAA